MGTINRICEITKKSLTKQDEIILFFVFKEDKLDEENVLNIPLYKPMSSSVIAAYDDGLDTFSVLSEADLDAAVDSFRTLTTEVLEKRVLLDLLSENSLNVINYSVNNKQFRIGCFAMLKSVHDMMISQEKKQDYSISKSIEKSCKEKCEMYSDFHFLTYQFYKQLNDKKQERREIEEEYVKYKKLEKEIDLLKLGDNGIIKDKIKFLELIKKNVSFDAIYNFVNVNDLCKVFGVSLGLSKYLDLIAFNSYFNSLNYTYEPTMFKTQGRGINHHAIYFRKLAEILENESEE